MRRLTDRLRRSPGRRTRSRSRGQTLIEFAMVIPLILLIVLGTVDLGRAVFSYNTLAQAARAGSRVAIVNQDSAVVRNKAIQAAVTLGLASSNVDVCFKTAASTQSSCANPATDNCPHTTRSIGCQAIVTVRSNFQPMTPFIGTIWSSIQLSSTSIAPIEHVCPTTGVIVCP